MSFRLCLRQNESTNIYFSFFFCQSIKKKITMKPVHAVSPTKNSTWPDLNRKDNPLVGFRTDSANKSLLYSYRKNKQFLYPFSASSCSVIGAPIYGTVSSSNNNAGSSLQFTCNSGYVLNGPSSRTCTGGKWTGSHPWCLGRKIFTAVSTRHKLY